MISDKTISEVKDLSIVDAIGKYVDDLKKTSNPNVYKAKSPFSNEKTPSFYVIANKGFFKDHSTGKGGDHIKFVIEKLGISYPDAIKELCQQFGIQIEYDNTPVDPGHEDKIKFLQTIIHATANRYVDELQGIFAWPLTKPDAIDPWRKEVYSELIERRRFTHNTIMQWQIGYAPGPVGDGYTPEKWNFLSKTLIEKGYSEQGIELGLVITKDKVNYDAFRNRIIYPIIDHYGRYVSFGGRALNHDQHNPKYLNGSDSPIYNKSKVLYGLHYAGEHIREKGFANLMEGYTDVISFHQAGHPNTIGTCGTALTDDQAKLLRKYTNKAVLFYDGDEAGQSASMRAIDILMRFGFVTSVVPMPTRVMLKENLYVAGTNIAYGPLMSANEAWNALVFITQRDKEKLLVKYGSDIITIPQDKVAKLDKIDPDELVRMFNA